MDETELAYLDEWQEAQAVVMEVFGSATVKELEERMKVIDMLPPVKGGPRISMKKANEVLEFAASGARFGEVEYYNCKTVTYESTSYRDVVKRLKNSGLIEIDIKVHQRGDKIYLERVKSTDDLDAWIGEVTRRYRDGNEHR